jgi:trans-aconitate 2-methyltransferase
LAGEFGWDPILYGHYGAPRLRPALELLARIHAGSPQQVHDLGTGRGELARAMADRWPAANVTGSDLSAEMLETARQTPSRVRWERFDIREWSPAGRYDVITSNAALHWIDGHEQLFPRMVSYLEPGGWLGVQMPLSWHEPSHRLMRDVLAAGGGDEPFGPATLRERCARRPVHEADWYYDLLAPATSTIDIWETRYVQVLDGDDPVLAWVSGTALRPILEALPDPDRGRFLERYRAALREAYPRRPDGTTLFPFPRLFIVAVK